MEIERKDVDTNVSGKEIVDLLQNKGNDEGLVSIETIVEEDEPVAGKTLPIKVPVVDMPVNGSRPTLERVSGQGQERTQVAVNAEKETGRSSGAEEVKLCPRCGKDHGTEFSDILRFMTGPSKPANVMFGEPSQKVSADGDSADPVTERFGLFDELASSGDAEKLDFADKTAYSHGGNWTFKYGFRRDDEKGDDADEKKEQSGTSGGGEEPCGLCGEIHAKESRPDSSRGFFILREGTQTAATAAKKDEKVADKDSTLPQTTKFLTNDEMTEILGRKGHLTDEERVANISWRRFREEQTQRIDIATKDMKRAATCKGLNQTFDIIEMLTETKRYVKKDELEHEFFPQWLYYALKELVVIAKKVVMTKNKYECLRLAKTIHAVYSNQRKEDKAAIKILKYAKGAVTIIAGEAALAFLEK